MARYGVPQGIKCMFDDSDNLLEKYTTNLADTEIAFRELDRWTSPEFAWGRFSFHHFFLQ